MASEPVDGLRIYAVRHRLDQVDRGPLRPCGLLRERVVPLRRQIQCRLVPYRQVRTSMGPASVLYPSEQWRPSTLVAVTRRD
jgi:hypothetical protein